MKIIYLVHQFFPEFQTGTEKFVLNTALMAQKFGNNVKVITHSSYPNEFYDHETNGILYKEFIYEGIPVVAFKYRRIPPHINLLLHNNLGYEFAKSVLKFEAPDIIHVGHAMKIHEFIWAAIEMHIPYTITLTDFFLLCPKINLTPDQFSLCTGPKQGEACAELCPEFNPPFITNRLSEAEEILKNADILVAPSRFVSSIYQHEFPDLDIKVIPHGIRYTHIKKNRRTYQQGAKLTFGYAGTLIYHKGVQVLLSAFSGIENRNTALKIYGSGQFDFTQQLKEISNGDPRVIFEGAFASEKLGDVLSQIDVLITPSICYETYSFILHEAFASNVPVIASNLGVMGEEVIDGYNGFSFKTGDADDLRDKMELMIKDPDSLNRMKENINSKIIVPTIEQEAYQYFEIYNRMFGIA